MIIRVDGERHQYGPGRERFLGSDPSRNEVEEWTWRKYRELEKQVCRRQDGLPAPMPFSALADRYEADQVPRLAPRTQLGYKSSLARFREYFVFELGDPMVDRIRAPHVRDFLRWREDRDGVGTRTLAKERVTLNVVFQYAIRDLDLIDFNPVANVHPPK